MSERGRFVVGRRELSSLSREKTIVLAVLVQLFVAAFSSFLVVGLTTLYSPDAVSGGGVEVALVGDASADVAAAAGEVEGVRVVGFDDADAALAAFETGRVDAVLDARSEAGRIAVTVTAPADSLRKTLVVVRVREVLEALERAERLDRVEGLSARPVPLPPGVDASPYFGFAYTVLVPLLLFLPVFVAGSIAVDGVTEELERGTLELLRVTPLSLPDIVEGKALAAGVLAPAQAALWVVLLSLNGIPVSNVEWVLLFVAALSLAAVALGVGLGLAVRDRQRAQLLYSFGVLAAFAVGAGLPEHPATTAALLAIDSPGPLTSPTVLGYCLLAVGVAAAVRAFVARLDPEGL